MFLMVLHIVKDGIIWISATAGGYFCSVIYTLLFQPTVSTDALVQQAMHWYDHPAVIAAIVAGLVTIIIKSWDHIDKWWNGRKEDKKEREKEEDDRHKTLDKLTQEGWQAYLSRNDAFHREQLAFKDSEILDLKISEYRARQATHAAFDEIQRLHGRIRIVEVLLAQCEEVKDSAPTFEFKFQDQILAGVEEKVDAYKQSLRNNIRAASGQENI